MAQQDTHQADRDQAQPADLYSIRAIGSVFETSGLTFVMGDIRADAVSAMRSEPLLRSLFAIGQVTMNLASPGMLRGGEMERNAGLAACLVDYALEVAPRAEDEPTQVDVPRTIAHAEFMAGRFDGPEIDPEFTKRVTAYGQMVINRQLRDGPGAERQPEQEG